MAPQFDIPQASDFYQCFAQTVTLPAKRHAIKIDKFFLRDIAQDPRNGAIVMAIVAMAHSLGMSVVAEGVERMDQFEFLRNMDWIGDRRPVCDRAQGFLFSHPLPADGATTLLAEQRRRWPAERERMTG